MEVLARTCKFEQMNVQRLVARGFVLVGAVLLFSMTFFSQFSYQGSPFAYAASFALIFAAGAVAVFVLGLFYENLAAIALLIGAVALIVWGIVGAWEAGTWGIMVFMFLIPMIVAAALYAAAARMQEICELR